MGAADLSPLLADNGGDRISGCGEGRIAPRLCSRQVLSAIGAVSVVTAPYGLHFDTALENANGSPVAGQLCIRRYQNQRFTYALRY